MKVLVIGSGGREHALVRAFKRSPSVTKIHALPGSQGISKDALCHSNVPSRDFEAVFRVVKSFGIELVVIGPEADLVSGLSNFLRDRGVLVFAPSLEASQLESSKIFAKQFMQAAQVPTSPWTAVNSVEETLAASSGFQPPFVLKADGLAAGKGVFICSGLEDLEEAAKKIFEEKIFGEMGALLEQHQSGYELSCLVMTNGQDYQILPFAQDHKRLLDGDLGPNTGGMGVVAPIAVNSDLLNLIREQVVERSLAEMKNRQFIYRGVLFIGLMITQSGPQTLEYNVRFGDPETQVLLPLIDGDLATILRAIARGDWRQISLRDLHVACVVLASPGYPENPEVGLRIEGDPEAETASSYFLHAGATKTEDLLWKTKGGRVLNVIGWGSSKQEALSHAYDLAKTVSWRGIQMRKDIGRKAPINQ